MKLIRETRRGFLVSRGYQAVCLMCNNQIEYDEEFVGIVMEETDGEYIICPTDIFYCPHCYNTLTSMLISKTKRDGSKHPEERMKATGIEMTKWD